MYIPTGGSSNMLSSISTAGLPTARISLT
jgi:hypothetical protein